MNALKDQVGGSHYKSLKIQPVEYIHANKLSFLEGNIVKYVTRHRAKGGRADIEKVIHYARLILELEYPPDVPSGNASSVGSPKTSDVCSGVGPFNAGHTGQSGQGIHSGHPQGTEAAGARRQEDY